MPRRSAYPFLTLNEDAVDAEPWLISVDGRPESEINKWIADWDYSSQIRLRRTLRVDWNKAVHQLQIPESQLALCVLVTEGTGPGTLPQRLIHLDPLPISRGNSGVLIQHHPDSRQLSQRLHLSTSIVIAKVPAKHGRLAPTTAGARVWSDVTDARLEGDEPRFPMEVVSFAAMFGSQAASSRAPWFLQWTPGDPNRDLHGAVRLYLNDDLKDVVEKIMAGDARLIQAMLADVISQLVEKTVIEEAYGDLGDCEPGSIGATVMSWISQAWPGESLMTIRSNLEYHPGRMRATMLAVADVGEMSDE